MPLDLQKDGLPIYASAREIGNIGAGFVAGKEGQTWAGFRFVADMLQSLQERRFSTEHNQSQFAQKLGYIMGWQNVLHVIENNKNEGK